MLRIFGSVSLVPLFILFTTLTARTRDTDPLMERLLSEFPSANAAAKDFYTNARIASVESIRHEPDQSEVEVKRLETRGNRDSLRSVITTLSSDDPEERMSLVNVANARLSFQLTKLPDANAYSIKSMGSAPPAELRSKFDGIRLNCLHHSAPYCYFELTLPDFFKADGVVLKSVKERMEGDTQVLRVFWEHSISAEHSRSGWFDLLPKSSWVLKSCEFQSISTDPKSKKQLKSTSHRVMEYSGEQDGIPLLLSIRSWNEGEDGRSPSTSITKVTDLKPDSCPPEDFQLEAFGISRTPLSRPVPVVYYLFGLAVLCGLMLLLLQYSKARYRKYRAL
jgi:hypothetical protein